MKRLFFALDVHSNNKNEIEIWRSHINFDANPIVKDNFHITLAFLGMQPDDMTEKLISHVNEILPDKIDHSIDSDSQLMFTVQASHLGLFKKPKVLYLGFSSFPKCLISLANTISLHVDSLGIRTDVRDYIPHLSLYRKATYIPTHKIKSIPIKIDSFSLYHSYSSVSGVQYKKLHTWALVQE